VVTPVAVATGQSMGVSALPLVVAVMFAASNGFLTPVSYQTNLFVYSPGGYRFTDFTRVGAPLVALMLLVATLVILGLGATRILLFIGLWLFFVGFNYLEATLPSMVSKVASPDGKGTAMGVYSTCQFLGVFGGGALGGLLVQHMGSTGLSLACLSLLAIWGLWVMLAPPAPVSLEDASPRANA